MPVLDAGGDVHRVAFLQFTGGLALLLVPAAARNGKQNLSASLLGLVDMPLTFRRTIR